MDVIALVEATFIGLPKHIKQISKEFAKNVLGISLSEYVRNLVLKDLDKRGLLHETVY